MSTNPLYEGTATLYSYLADSRDIKTLDLGKSNNNNISEIYSEIPLQVSSIISFMHYTIMVEYNNIR